MMLLLELLLQRRQSRLGGRDFGLLGQHVGPRRGADLELIFDDDKLIAFDLDDVAGRFDLAAQRRFLDGGRHYVRGQRQIGRFQFEAFVVGLRRRRFDLPALAAEYVRRIGDVDAGLVQIEQLRRPAAAERRRRELLALGRRLSIRLRQQLAGLGVEIFLGLPQRRLRSLQIRIGLQRLGDQTVEFPGMEHLPPLAGDIAAGGETLCRAAGNAGRDGRRRFRFGGIARDRAALAAS